MSNKLLIEAHRQLTAARRRDPRVSGELGTLATISFMSKFAHIKRIDGPSVDRALSEAMDDVAGRIAQRVRLKTMNGEGRK